MNILSNMEVGGNHQMFAAFHLVYRMCREEPDFRQLITSMSNDT